MDSLQYNSQLSHWRSANELNLSDLAQWTEQIGLPWLWHELAGILGRKQVGPLAPEHTIRQGLQATLAERRKMPLKPTFYHAQLTMLDSQAKKYLGAVKAFNGTTAPYAPKATMRVLHDGLHGIMGYGTIFLEQAGQGLLHLRNAYGGWARRQEHPFEIFSGARQIIYGRFSGIAHDDVAPFVSVAVIRTALENRLRSAFGVYGFYNHKNMDLKPIMLGDLFDAIQPRLSQIEFAVDFHDIARIYRWSNPYLHAGWRDFVWVPGYVLDFLTPLFIDGRNTPAGGWDINGGIRMPREVWREIRSSFKESKRPGRFEALLQAVLGLFHKRSAASVFELNAAEEDRSTCLLLD